MEGWFPTPGGSFSLSVLARLGAILSLFLVLHLFDDVHHRFDDRQHRGEDAEYQENNLEFPLFEHFLISPP